MCSGWLLKLMARLEAKPMDVAAPVIGRAEMPGDLSGPDREVSC